MYGAQWSAAVPLAQVLCVVGAVELIFRFSNHALFSLGLARQANGLQFIVQGLRVAGVMAVIPFGLPGAVLGLFAAAVLGAVVTQRTLARHAGFLLRDVSTAAWPSLKLTALSVLPFGLWVLLQTPAETNYIVMGFGGAVLTAVSWLAAACVLRHPIWPEVLRVLSSARARLAR
jgi:hypothetical protein